MFLTAVGRWWLAGTAWAGLEVMPTRCDPCPVSKAGRPGQYGHNAILLLVLWVKCVVCVSCELCVWWYRPHAPFPVRAWDRSLAGCLVAAAPVSDRLHANAVFGCCVPLRCVDTLRWSFCCVLRRSALVAGDLLLLVILAACCVPLCARLSSEGAFHRSAVKGSIQSVAQGATK
jgi:hypothetical protein